MALAVAAPAGDEKKYDDKNVGLHRRPASSAWLHSAAGARAMETLLAGLFLDRSRGGRAKREAWRPSGVKRLAVAVAVIAAGFVGLDRAAPVAPASGLSVAAPCDPTEQGEPQCIMSVWSMARKATSMP
jgi:hypothetical protein